MVKKISKKVAKQTKDVLQNITNSKIGFAVAAFILGALVTYFSICLANRNYILVNVKQQEVKGDKAVAKVNGEKIYSSEVNAQLSRISADLTFDKLQDEGKKLVLNEIVAQKILQKKVIKAKRFTADEMTREMLLGRLGQDYLRELAAKEVSKKEIRAKYDELVKQLQGKEEFKISHILVAKQSDLGKIFAQMHTKSFEEVAKELSLDKKTAANGGDLGYIPENIMIDEFKNNVKSLKVGQVSKPFKSQIGWHVVKLTDRRPAQVAKFEEVEDRIRNSLAEDGKKDYVKKMLDNAKIEILK